MPSPQAGHKTTITQWYTEFVLGLPQPKKKILGDLLPLDQLFTKSRQVLVSRDDKKPGDYMLYVSPFNLPGAYAEILLDRCDVDSLATEGIANSSLVAGWAVMTRGYGLPPIRTVRITTGRPSTFPFDGSKPVETPPSIGQHPAGEVDINIAGYSVLAAIEPNGYLEYFFVTDNAGGSPITLYAIEGGTVNTAKKSAPLQNNQFVCFDPNTQAGWGPVMNFVTIKDLETRHKKFVKEAVCGACAISGKKFYKPGDGACECK